MSLQTESGAAEVRRRLQRSAFALMAPDEHDAFARMLVASLPLPPLPVLVLDGFPQLERAGDMASSFDLLRHAVVAWQTAHPARGSAPALVRAKGAVLARLRAEMRAHCAGGEAASPAWVERAHEIFCAAFRAHVRLYAPVDVRFFPAAAVAPDAALVREGSRHWQGGAGRHFGSYASMVRAYALALGAADA
jgi:hypothetical protein